MSLILITVALASIVTGAGVLRIREAGVKLRSVWPQSVPLFDVADDVAGSKQALLPALAILLFVTITVAFTVASSFDAFFIYRPGFVTIGGTHLDQQWSLIVAAIAVVVVATLAVGAVLLVNRLVKVLRNASKAWLVASALFVSEAIGILASFAIATTRFHVDGYTLLSASILATLNLGFIWAVKENKESISIADILSALKDGLLWPGLLPLLNHLAQHFHPLS